MSPTPVATDHPQPSWTRNRYGDTGTQPGVEGITIAGTGHTLPQAGMLAYAISFLGLDTTGGGGGTATGPVRSTAAGRCLDVPGRTTTQGTRTQIWDCNSGTNQTWTVTAAGQLTVYSGNTLRCLDAEGGGTTTGHGRDHLGVPRRGEPAVEGQRRRHRHRNAAGLCLEVAAGSTANGTAVRLGTCNGGQNQKWTTPAASR